MKGNQQYWNPSLETLPQEKLAQLRLRKFKDIFRWAYEHSPFYHRLYQNAGIEPGDIKTYDDIRKVPRVDKALLRDVSGKEPFPYGEILCVPLNEVTAYRQTTGTTGQAVYVADTWQDWEMGIESYAFALYAQGYRDYDRVFFPFGSFIGLR